MVLLHPQVGLTLCVSQNGHDKNKRACEHYYLPFKGKTLE